MIITFRAAGYWFERGSVEPLMLDLQRRSAPADFVQRSGLMRGLATCTLLLLYAASGVASSQLSTARRLPERYYDRAEGCQAFSLEQRIECGESAAMR